jgi:hypothetical protein
MRHFRSLVACVALSCPLSSAFAGDLGGSPASMEVQHAVAVEADYSFLRKPADVEHLAELGRLVKLEGNGEYSLSDVSFPYARPEVRALIESVAADYHDEFGFKLVVTSLTRPKSQQPSNAHELSVHPAGMATDLRVPSDSKRRAWLERRLLALEDAGAIDVTREKHPPHYHVAVFAEKYLPIAVTEQAARTERRARAQLARIDDLASVASVGGPQRSLGLGVLLGILSALAVGGPLAVVRKPRA